MLHKGGGGGRSLHPQTLQLFPKIHWKFWDKKIEIDFMPKGNSCKIIQFWFDLFNVVLFCCEANGDADM
jgi:hypothetical protein